MRLVFIRVSSLWNLCLLLVSVIFVKYGDSQRTRGGGGGGGYQGISKEQITTNAQWIMESLEIHNFYRSMHHAAPLVLNSTLSEISQYYANQLLQRALQDLNQGRQEVFFDHNPQIGPNFIGENLYYSIAYYPADPVPPYWPVQLWYEEIKDYDFATAGRKPTSDPKAKIGHLTQLLWKTTTSMGTALAAAKWRNNQTIAFVVANYYPTGNVPSLILQNVLPGNIPDEDINKGIVSKDVERWWMGQETKHTTHKSWRKHALKQHNVFRKAHGVAPFRLNNDLCKVSQIWAEYLLERGLQAFNSYGVLNQIEPNSLGTQLCNFGENSLYFVTGANKVSASAPVKMWYKEEAQYDFNDNQNPAQSRVRWTTKTAKFEQIIWNSTTEFCISYASEEARNGQFLTYIVANYYPPQNPLERKQNIFKRNPNVLIEEISNEYETEASIWGTLLIVICTLGGIVVVIGGLLFALYKFRRSWYNDLMTVTRIKNKS